MVTGLTFSGTPSSNWEPFLAMIESLLEGYLYKYYIAYQLIPTG